MRRPETEAAVLAAADAGEIAESPYLDVKRELDSGNRETAKDLAAFAIDGGALLIGLEEDKAQRRFTPSPVVLDGVAEKLEQIAENRIDPPLPIRVFDIPTAADPTRGYVWVEIPASDVAPHMVGGIYYARTDRTTRRLGDADVLRLHRARTSEADSAVGALDTMVTADEHPYSSENPHGRLYVVAQPLTGGSSLAERLLWSDATAVKNIVMSASLPEPLRVDPAPTWSVQAIERADGQSLVPPRYGAPDRPVNPKFEYEVRFLMDGGGRAQCGRMTDELSSGFGGSEDVILDVMAVAYANLVSQWAAQVAEQTGYRGAWALGLHATGLRGRFSYRLLEGFGFRGDEPRYPESTFRSTTRAGTKELAEAPESAAYRLTRRLLRPLRNDGYFRDLLGVTS